MVKRIPLGVELARLEQTDPAVKAAAESYDATVRRILDDRLPHPLPCAVEGCVWHSAEAPEHKEKQR